MTVTALGYSYTLRIFWENWINTELVRWLRAKKEFTALNTKHFVQNNDTFRNQIFILSVMTNNKEPIYVTLDVAFV